MHSFVERTVSKYTQLNMFVLCVIKCSYLVAGEVVKPTVTIDPSVLRVQQGTRAEFRCTANGNPAPSIEWTGKVLKKLTLKKLNIF